MLFEAIVMNAKTRPHINAKGIWVKLPWNTPNIKAEPKIASVFEYFDKEERTVETSKCGVMVEGHGNSTLGRTNLM